MSNLGKVRVFFEKPDDQFATIEVEEGPFLGIKFQYGKVEFDEKEPVLSFEVNNLSRVIGEEDWENFQTFAGNLLVEIIEESAKMSTLHFKGGTDATD